MLPLGEVQQLVLDRCSPLGVADVAVADSLGCVLAEDVLAEGDVPPFANTAMDGYAVRSEDTDGAPVELRVVGVLPAGCAPPEIPLGPGEALQIMTGAPMPPGADAVVMVEQTSPGSQPNTVRIDKGVVASENVRRAGSDFPAGAVALLAGSELGPAHLGVLATAGRSRVHVWRRPRVGVMSTGDELVEPGEPLRIGQIRDSNRLILLSLLRRDGFEAVDLGVVRDSEQAVEEALRSALARCDAVLSSGGVSKGEFDYVKVMLDRLASDDPGAESFELSVSIRPAKPLALAWIARPDGGGRVALFGLPGNPVSSMVSYQVVALPGLRKMAGHPEPLPPAVPATAGERLPGDRGGRLHLMRVDAQVAADGRIEVRSAGGQQSHQLSGVSAANALALVPPPDGVAPGDPVEILLVGPLRPAP